MTRSVLFWRRLDLEGLERLELTTGPDGIDARGTVLALEDGGFRLEHAWRLDPNWRPLFLTVERWNDAGHARLTLERDGDGWSLDGAPRPDLDGAEAPDISVTPFCNTLPIRRLAHAPGESRTLDVAYVDGPAMTVQRSRQRYLRKGRDLVRYVDLGVAAGFEADLRIDDRGLVLAYEGLFERLEPRPAEA